MIYVARRANHFGFAELMSSLKIKNISLFPNPKSALHPMHPVPLRGASAIVTNEGRVAVDALAATDERGQGVRQKRVVLTPQRLASSLNGGAKGPTGPRHQLP